MACTSSSTTCSSPGPCTLPGCANFTDTDIATLSRTRAHSIRFSIDFKPGPGNDVVRIYIDGTRRITGTTWEDYYRYDPESSGAPGPAAAHEQADFRESGSPDPLNLGQGFLVDGVYLASSTPAGEGDCGRNDDSDRAERDAVSHMNQQRAAAFLPPLTVNSASSESARKHSCDMHRPRSQGRAWVRRLDVRRSHERGRRCRSSSTRKTTVWPPIWPRPMH